MPKPSQSTTSYRMLPTNHPCSCVQHAQTISIYHVVSHAANQSSLFMRSTCPNHLNLSRRTACCQPIILVHAFNMPKPSQSITSYRMLPPNHPCSYVQHAQTISIYHVVPHAATQSPLFLRSTCPNHLNLSRRTACCHPITLVLTFNMPKPSQSTTSYHMLPTNHPCSYVQHAQTISIYHVVSHAANQSSLFMRSTCPNHLNLPRRITCCQPIILVHAFNMPKLSQSTT